jgi:putative aldouronate transport system permease protein
VQTVSYLPFFLAWISVIGIVYSLCEEYGPINDIIVRLTGNESSRSIILANQNLFFPLAVLLNLWKNVGWGTIIYLAAIAGIDQQIYEAARIDGANRFQQALHVTFQGIKPTIVMILILSVGSIVSDNFELVYGLKNPYIQFDVIGTVVYDQGITRGNYSVATAFGFTQGIVQMLLVLAANMISKRVSGIGVF